MAVFETLAELHASLDELLARFDAAPVRTNEPMHVLNVAIMVRERERERWLVIMSPLNGVP